MTTHKFSNLKKIFLVLTVIILLVTVKLFDSVTNSRKKFEGKKWIGRTETKPTQQFGKGFLKIFHLDLKGGPPKLRFLLNVLPYIRQAGANAILIEYEDMFPFSGFLKNISAINAYSFGDVKRFVKFAEYLKMEVIPLIQTFGHLEYMLKLEEFQGLRELDTFPQEICPLNKDAVNLIKEMIRQIMRIHVNSQYIHIGCDEVRHVGACSRCSRMNSKKLFSSHVIRIAEYIKTQYPGVTPLIWDDMLRGWTFNDVANSGLGSAVEPVIWVYGNNIFTLVPPFTWNIYQRIFPKLWVASAFKGASGETQVLPNITHHWENHLAWMRVLSRVEEQEVALKLEISGIFLTGWSRYDHFAGLCELLPVGIPSLVLGLTFLDHKSVENYLEGFSKWLKILRCPNYLPSDIKNEFLFQKALGNCSFPGSDLYSGMIKFQRLRERVRKMTKKVETSGWISKYNLEKNFSSPWRLLEMFPEEGFAGEILKKEISLWKSFFFPIMEQYFDVHTRTEWEEQNVNPLEEELAEIQNKIQKLILRKTWPRRPLRNSIWKPEILEVNK